MKIKNYEIDKFCSNFNAGHQAILIYGEDYGLKNERVEAIIKNYLDNSNNVIYSDRIISKGAYNILEDEIISTKASKESLNADLSLNAAKFVLDKIYLFMRKQ